MFYNGRVSDPEAEVLPQVHKEFCRRDIYVVEIGSMTGIIEELKWETFQKRKKDNRLILLYKGLKVKPGFL